MNDLTVFKNEQFGEVRTVEESGKVFFCGKDVAVALGYSNTKDALIRHCRKDGVAFHDLIDNLGRSQQVKFVDEGNLYRLITHSKLPEAEKFESWVFDEVLPTIRKTGQYIDKPTPDDKIAKDLAEAKARNARAREASLYLRLGEKAANPIYRDILYSYSTKALSGEFLLPLPAAPRKTYSATEIGEMLGISANRVGRLAESNNLKTEQYGTLVWDIAPNTHKQVQSFRYYLNVLDALRELLEVA